MPIQKKIFTKGMNSDLADEFMPEGSDRYRLNLRVMASDGADLGVIQTMNGNTKVSFTLPSGTNTCIGTKEDQLRKRSYYFIYNTIPANNLILQYDSVSNTITKVLQSDVLNFSINHLITGINIIELDQDNHLLYWTDANEEPRKINIEKAIYHTTGNFTLGYPAVMTKEFTYRAKYPMPLSPVTNYTDVSSVPTNKLDKKLFQFKVRNVFDDKEVSSWSPISKTAFPQSYLIESQNNAILINVKTGSEIVKRLQIAVREVGETDFKLVTDIDKEEQGISSNGNYVYVFYNDGNYSPLELASSINLFDRVPRKSQSQEIGYGNRINDGLITEGFDAVPIDLKLEYTLAPATNPGVTATTTILPVNARKRGGKYVDGVIYYDDANRSGATNINEGKHNSIQHNGNYGTELFIPFYTEGTSGVLNIVVSSFAGGVSFNVGDTLLDVTTGASGVITISGVTFLAGIWTYTLSVTTVGVWNVGDTVSDITGLDVGVINVSSDSIGGSYPIINWTLFNEPPSWATHYQFARQKNASNGRYIQFLANNIVYLDKDGMSLPYAYNNPLVTQFKIIISPIDSDFAVENPGSLLHYDWVKGDRIRFIKNSSKLFYDEYLDFEIALYEAPSHEVRVRYPIGYTPVNFDSAGGDWFEIYHPSLTVDSSTQLTWEFGHGGDVSQGANGRYLHSGDTNNQVIANFTSATFAGTTLVANTSTGHGMVANDIVKIKTSGYSIYGTVASTTLISVTITTTTALTGTFSGVLTGTVSKGAKGLFDGGDTFYRPRTMQFAGNTSSYTYIIEDYSYSDLFIGNGYDYGRPNRIDPDYREITRPSTVYWSEAFIPETNINGLSTVYEDSFQTYEAKYGGIYKLYAEDQLIYIYQELKIGGVRVEQIIIDSGNGNSIVGVSSNVLPTRIDYLQGEMGIGKHPESFDVYNKAKYGIDVLRGVIWRQSINGLTPISDLASMHNFTTDICKLILSCLTKVNIYGQYDVRFGEYVMAFDSFRYGPAISPITNPATTLAFNEKTNMFSSFYSYNPEMMGSNGIDIISFKNGELYTHNTNAVQGEFYGVVTQPEVWVVMNEAPSNEKILEAISEETNSAWEVYDISTPNGQQSNLIVADFEEKNNLQYAAVLRDTSTPNLALPLIEGDVLVDTTFLAKLRYTLTTPTRIFAINFHYIISNLSNR